MDRDLRPLTVDKDALQLSNAKYKKEEVKIYVEHLVQANDVEDEATDVNDEVVEVIDMNDEVVEVEVEVVKEWLLA
ncbi:hypothetical protein DEO72_LG2g4848 [Vigna unguiculata]|uniref:Uncharacterized protein n=1 Tax=Vigna unguiculata TaxID=3917 RepID=A0A4D6L7U8_VIGUN|nr:hypothetical protein DEO72_LG2g4848 [Vigna unguiculata]